MSELFNQVLERWQFIRDENHSQRHLVTEKEWDTWTSFEKLRNEKLDSFYDQVSAGMILSDDDIKWMEDFAKELHSAKHQTREELEERARENNRTVVNNDEVKDAFEKHYKSSTSVNVTKTKKSDKVNNVASGKSTNSFGKLFTLFKK